MPSVSAKQAELARATPLSARVTIRFHEAAVLSGLAVGKLQQMVYAGHIQSIKIGRARLIKTDSLLKLLRNGLLPTPQPRKRRS